MSNKMDLYLAAIEHKASLLSPLDEKTLTAAELKKREEVAKAIERDNPGMDKSKKMAIATATAKKVAEETESLVEAHELGIHASNWNFHDSVRHIEGVVKKHGGKMTHQDAKETRFSFPADKIEKAKSDLQSGDISVKHYKGGMSEEVDLEEVESIDEANEYGAIAAKHAKDFFDKDSTPAQRDYAKKMLKRALEASKIKDSEAAKKHYMGVNEEVDLEEATDNLPGKSTHVLKRDVRHPAGGIVRQGTTLRHVKGAQYEIRAGKGKGWIVGLAPEHVQKLEEGKTHTVPKTEKEKDLAAAAEPKDKITHKDVLVKRGVLSKEEIERLDELSKKTLGNYVQKAAHSMADARGKVVGMQKDIEDIDRFTNRHMDDKFSTRDELRDKMGASRKEVEKQHDVVAKRFSGIKSATHRLTKEEVEQLDEMKDGKSYTQDQLKKKIESGNWEATQDIKPGKHVEMRHHTGKRVTVHVKEEVEIDEAYGRDLDWGSMSKRQFKHAELEHELRHEVAPRRSSYGARRSSAPSTPQTKIYHKVPFAQKDDAKAEGMRFDGDKKKWYHTDANKSSQSKFQKEDYDMNEAAKPAKKPLPQMPPIDHNEPTAVKIYHHDKDTGKEHGTELFSAQSAAQHERELKKAGHKVVARALMFGKKEGQRVPVKESVDLEEAASQHRVSVTVSDPNHTAVSKRKELTSKRVIVNAENKDHAVAKAKEFYKKKGYKVHDAEYHSVAPKAATKVDEAIRRGFDWRAAEKTAANMKAKGYERGDSPYTWRKVKPAEGKPEDKKQQSED